MKPVVTKFLSTACHGLFRNPVTFVQTREIDYENNEYHNRGKSNLLGLHESLNVLNTPTV